MNNILNEFKIPIKDFKTNFNKIVSIILLSLLVTLLNLCPPIIIKNIIDIGILEKNLKLFLSFVIFLLVISIITPILDYILSIINKKVHN